GRGGYSDLERERGRQRHDQLLRGVETVAQRRFVAHWRDADVQGARRGALVRDAHEPGAKTSRGSRNAIFLKELLSTALKILHLLLLLANAAWASRGFVLEVVDEAG